MRDGRLIQDCYTRACRMDEAGHCSSCDPKPESNTAATIFHQAWGYAKEHSDEIEGGYDKAAFSHVQFWLSKVTG